MKRKSVQHHMDGLAAMLLFCVFAACVLMVLLTGADIYRKLTERDRGAYDYRTFAQYVATRVRQSDTLDGISVADFEGVPALCLNGEPGYGTWIYCFDGYLMELYAAVDAGLSPEAGERLLPAEEFTPLLADGLLTVRIAGPEGREELRFSLRSGGGAAA